jgi:endonuclease/exonuclease/phosphatase family metal-dependent hydrolase
MVTNTCEIANLPAVSIGRAVQKPLSRSGDRVRCDWGYVWLVGPTAPQDGVSSFVLAYDDIKSIRFFGEDLPAWWRRDGLGFEAMLTSAVFQRTKILDSAKKFDEELYADLLKVGGEKYATLASLAYRQTYAACKLVADKNNQPIYLSKEQGSNGCIGTVDILYPQSPQMLLFSPTLFRAMLAPILMYASSDKWPWPFAPHDIGKYPYANGMVYNGGMKCKDESKLMPVEECGNMIISLAALAHIEGNASFAAGWWPLVTKWVQYLEKFGFDPGNQLCTDDFAGHLAHNSNLAVKTIVAIKCYANLAKMLGDETAAEKYSTLAKNMVPKWMEAAKGGMHGSYRLAYDRPGTWSMKYNLVWDKVLGLDIFPRSVAEAEVNAYRKLMKPYGLPLDNRKLWTKTDWAFWCSVLSDDKKDFDMIVDSVYRFANESPSRVAFSDWYRTDNAKHIHFVGRSVIGGVFMPLLGDVNVWRKYASRDKGKTGIYASIQNKTSTGDKGQAIPFNLATFNIRVPADSGIHSWQSRLPAVLSVIENRKIDIVGLQEATKIQYEQLDEALGPKWGRIGVGRNSKKKGESTNIMYKKDRFECLDSDTFWLSDTPNVPGSKIPESSCQRICTWGLFRDKLTGKKFRFYNTHLDHVSKYARSRGIEILLSEMLRLSQGETVFLTGDFNEDFSNVPQSIRFHAGRGCGQGLYFYVNGKDAISKTLGILCDTLFMSSTQHEGPDNTFAAYHTRNFARIDYIFATRDVSILKHITCSERPNGIHPSDHDAVVVTVVQ